MKRAITLTILLAMSTFSNAATINTEASLVVDIEKTELSFKRRAGRI